MIDHNQKIVFKANIIDFIFENSIYYIENNSNIKNYLEEDIFID